MEKSSGDSEPATVATLRWLRWTAARRGEAVALDWADIAWSDGLLRARDMTIPPTAYLKVRHDAPAQSRHSPVPPEAVAALRPLRAKVAKA